MTAEHREAIWDKGSYQPGYGKGVCEFDGQPWPCKYWAAWAAARPLPPSEALGEAIREAWHGAVLTDECWIDYSRVIKELAARGYVLTVKGDTR